MTTVMALAVVAVMIAKAINVNNHIEMGKELLHHLVEVVEK